MAHHGPNLFPPEIKKQILERITGEQQVERYNLAEHVDKIEALRRTDGLVDLMVFPKSADEETSTFKAITGIKPEKLDEVVGKDLAEKILAQPKQGGTEARRRT